MNRSAEIEPIKVHDKFIFSLGMDASELFSRSVARIGLGYIPNVPEDADDEYNRSLDQNLDFADRGWNFSAGDPEFWRYQDMLLVPGGKVLDIGMGYGRSSLPFALRGMDVVGYENDPTVADSMNELLKSFSFLPIEIREADALEANFEPEEYDTAVLSMAFIHLKNKEQAQKLIDKAFTALKPGGHIYIRTYSDQGFEYNDLKVDAAMFPYQVWQQDRYRFLTEHGHGHSHGHGEPETVLFFAPLEIPGYLIDRGMVIKNTRVIPSPGINNTMFGEDARANKYNQGDLYYTGVAEHEDQTIYGGMVTVIAQKPLVQAA